MMAVINTHANRCDLCGHEWLGNENATHCASSKCRSRQWNAAAKQLAAQSLKPNFEHDPKTCRIYKCGRCAVAHKKGGE